MRICTNSAGHLLTDVALRQFDLASPESAPRELCTLVATVHEQACTVPARAIIYTWT